MAIYAGETVRVFALGDDWDDTPLSPAQVDGVMVTISDDVGEVVVNAPMIWVPEESRWRYDWSSSAVAGAYSIEVTFSTPTGTSVDVRRVTLESPRTVVPPRQPLFVRV